MSADASLPFLLYNQTWDYVKASGLLHMRKSSLLLEYEEKKGPLGLLGKKVISTPIPFSEILSITLKKGWFSTQVLIQTKSMAITQNVPNSQQGQLHLSITKENRGIAESFVNRVSVNLTDRELKQIQKDLDQWREDTPSSNGL